MADYVALSNESVNPNSPLISATMYALRDNLIATMEGATGAPRLVNGAVTDGTLGAEKFQGGSGERDWVLARTAGAAAGALGTYAMLKIDRNDNDTLPLGTTASGSNLRYACINNSGIMTGGTWPSGTWRLMSVVLGVPGEGINPVVAVWLRIA